MPVDMERGLLSFSPTSVPPHWKIEKIMLLENLVRKRRAGNTGVWIGPCLYPKNRLIPDHTW